MEANHSFYCTNPARAFSRPGRQTSNDSYALDAIPRQLEQSRNSHLHTDNLIPDQSPWCLSSIPHQPIISAVCPPPRSHVINSDSTDGLGPIIQPSDLYGFGTRFEIHTYHLSFMPASQTIVSVKSIIYNVITLGLPHHYYKKFRHSAQHRTIIPLTSEPSWSSTVSQLVDGWGTALNLSAATVLVCVTTLLQLLDSNGGALYRTIVIIALLCACGGIAAGVMYIGHKSSLTCPWLEHQWLEAGTRGSWLWTMLALPVILLAWAAILVLVAILCIAYGKLTGSVSDIISGVCIAIALFLVLGSLYCAQKVIVGANDGSADALRRFEEMAGRTRAYMLESIAP